MAEVTRGDDAQDAVTSVQMDLPFEVEALTPEECGWVRLAGGYEYVTYEKPNGELYVFPPGRPLLIQRFKRSW